MNFCSDILAISAISCHIAQCLSTDELSVLAADLSMLGDALNAIAARRSLAETSEQDSSDNSE